ncbi:glycerophosphodiester phosphodiesterase [Zoogloea sp.]|uniref:glycerophosphodiester phosphodiesterase n=1 Tax=Zoogloea sp. TaxID=49181 RepID=UPI0026115349|nr:glycerophosphodiester phosphodiesterase [Zoogloea sp.]MDD3354954.1 glycerophosphodiester phosphodiesterase [Zoogloea sp.]
MPAWIWPRVLAHRCGGAHAPENTLAGLSLAARLGCKAVEFDVMLSADQIPVLIHDETLDRTAGRTGSVAGLPAAVLLGTDVGRRFHPAFAGECIPSLIAALEACRWLGLSANIEIKPAAGHEVHTGAVVGRLLAEWAPSLRPPVLLSSFSVEALEAARQEAPDLPRGFLVDGFSPASIERALDLGCHALHLGLQGLEAGHLAATRAAGLRTLVYTVNRPEDWRQLLAWGVDGVFSDRPDSLLDERGIPI